jgi:hypothetical protein
VIDWEEAMIKINGHCSFPRPLLAIAMTLGLLVGGTMSAQAGTVTATGANGANGACGHGGGAGGAATATTITPGDPSNDATAQGGTGGTGGNLCPPGKSFPRAGVGGSGGAATATATTKVATGSASATANGTGGKGGAGGRGSGDFFPNASGGTGGGATVTSSAAAAGAGAVSSSATAYGGNGGATGGSFLHFGGGGGASAVASGQSTGSGSVDASATAYGGSGDFGGAATANATGVARTGNAQTNASATGGRGSGSVGSAPGTAFAESDAKNASGEVLTTASSPGGSVGTAAAAGSVSLDAADVGAGRAVSNAVLTGPGIAEGDMSGGYGGSGSSATYEATTTFDFTASKSEALDLNLLSDNFSGIGFDSLELQVTPLNGTTQTYTFSSLTGSEGPEAFFAANPLPLGTISAGAQSSVSLSYYLAFNAGTEANVGDGFGFTYIADPPLAGSAPETSTWVMMLLGSAGLAFAGYRRSRKAAAFAV